MSIFLTKTLQQQKTAPISFDFIGLRFNPSFLFLYWLRDIKLERESNIKNIKRILEHIYREYKLTAVCTYSRTQPTIVRAQTAIIPRRK